MHDEPRRGGQKDDEPPDEPIEITRESMTAVLTGLKRAIAQMPDAPEEPPGFLEVLNCGAGDLKFRFDRDDPAEVEQARRVIQDMLKRGYVILAEIDGEYRKVKGFDAEKDLYLIHEAPGTTPQESEATDAAEPGEATPEKKKRGRPSRKGIPLAKGKVTAFAPTAGG